MKLIVSICAVEVDVNEYDFRKETDELKADIGNGIRAFMRDMFPNVNVSIDNITLADNTAHAELLKKEAKYWNIHIRERFNAALKGLGERVKFHSDQTHELAQATREMDNEFFPAGSVGIIRVKRYYSIGETIMTDDVWNGICENPKEYCLVEMTCVER